MEGSVLRFNLIFQNLNYANLWKEEKMKGEVLYLESLSHEIEDFALYRLLI